MGTVCEQSVMDVVQMLEGLAAYYELWNRKF
jgi:hypothetical protein